MLLITILPPFLLLTITLALTLDTLYFVQLCSIILCMVIGHNWPAGRKSELYTLALVAPTVWCIAV